MRARPRATRRGTCLAWTSASEAGPSGAAPVDLLAADYFDGASARAHAVTLRRSGPLLQVRGGSIVLDLDANAVSWSERTRHGPRVAHLKGGGSLHCRDARSCDAWLRAAGRTDSVIVRAQQSWRWALGGLAGLALVLTLLGVWGVPGLARVALYAVAPSVDRELGQAALATLDKHLTQPSALPVAQQQRVRDAFARAVAAQPAGSVPRHELLFRRGRGKDGLGPNAFALPGGTMVMTDALVELFPADPDVLSGVLAHELGHLQRRHGMRMVLQASLIGLVSGLVLGDFSSLLAAVPVVLGQASYSRDAEREADAFCAAFLKSAGVSPAVMVGLFEKLAAARDANRSEPNRPAADAPSWLGIAIGSHPLDQERIEFFRNAAR